MHQYSNKKLAELLGPRGRSAADRHRDQPDARVRHALFHDASSPIQGDLDLIMMSSPQALRAIHDAMIQPQTRRDNTMRLNHQHDERYEEASDEIAEAMLPPTTFDAIAKRQPPAQQQRLAADRQRDRERRLLSERLQAQGHTINAHAVAISDEILEAMTTPSTAEFIRQQRSR